MDKRRRRTLLKLAAKTVNGLRDTLPRGERECCALNIGEIANVGKRLPNRQRSGQLQIDAQPDQQAKLS